MGGPYMSVKPMNNGKQLLVHFGKKIFSDKLLYRTKELNDIPVKVTPHKTLNYSQCVIWCKGTCKHGRRRYPKGIEISRCHKSRANEEAKRWTVNTRRLLYFDCKWPGNPQRNQNWVSHSRHKSVYTKSPTMLQLSKVWPQQKILQKWTKMCKMRTDRSWGSRLRKWNKMCQLRWWSPCIHKKLSQMKNWKGNPQKKISKQHIFSWSQTTSWRTCNRSIQKFICYRYQATPMDQQHKESKHFQIWRRMANSHNWLSIKATRRNQKPKVLSKQSTLHQFCLSIKWNYFTGVHPNYSWTKKWIDNFEF